ncbi:hypothetical protein GTW41_27125 [Streptomyces sp. SID4941]|nr:hypothetical protein [Streptomyces sp. SID4941]
MNRRTGGTGKRPALCGTFGALDHRRPPETVCGTQAAVATFPVAVRETEEVVPVNAVSTWVLPSGVTVGR